MNLVKVVTILLQDEPRSRSNVVNNEGDSMLHLLAKRGNVQLLPTVFKTDCPVVGVNKDKQTALHIAVRHRQLEFINMFLERIVDVVNIKDTKGFTALHWAAEVGADIEIVELLLSHGAKLNEQTDDGHTPLHLLVVPVQSHTDRSKRLEMIDFLLQNHIGHIDLFSYDRSGDTPFHRAVRLANTDTLCRLWAKGCHGDIQNKKTPLNITLDEPSLNDDQRRDLLRTLFDLGADPNQAQVLAKKIGSPTLDYINNCIHTKPLKLKDLIQKPGEIRNLVFQGGSVKGVAYIGALKKLLQDKRIKIERIVRVGGTSAGSITAGLMAAGYQLEEVEEKLGGLNFENFLDSNIDIKKSCKVTSDDFKLIRDTLQRDGLSLPALFGLFFKDPFVKANLNWPKSRCCKKNCGSLSAKYEH